MINIVGNLKGFNFVHSQLLPPINGSRDFNEKQKSALFLLELASYY